MGLCPDRRGGIDPRNRRHSPASWPHLDGGSGARKMESLLFRQSRLSELAVSAEARKWSQVSFIFKSRHLRFSGVKNGRVQTTSGSVSGEGNQNVHSARLILVESRHQRTSERAQQGSRHKPRVLQGKIERGQ